MSGPIIGILRLWQRRPSARCRFPTQGILAGPQIPTRVPEAPVVAIKTKRSSLRYAGDALFGR